jgi:hypothetical protein
MPRVYLLYHNLGSGFAQHNMWVATSTDGGATFGEPVPVALPGSDAYADLQCADSGGPSDIAVNQKTGRIYVFFTTRGAPQSGGVDFGGCAAQPLEFNIVNATRVWVATSADGSPGSWSDHLAVDDSKSGQVVSMQLAYGALDNQGNVYVAYPEAPQPYPHLAGAAVKLVTQQTDGTKDLSDTGWSKPKTLVQPNTGGSLLVHMVAGDPGKIDVAFFKGKDIGAKDPASGQPGTAWYLHVVQAFDALSNDVHPLEYEVSPVAAYTWSAENMMGLCSDPNDPTGGVQNGVNCDRSTDVWGVALDSQCRLSVTWPVTKPHNSANPDDAGTWISTQTGGDTLCSSSSGPPTVAAGGSGVPASCHDKRAPSTRVQGVRATRRSLRVHGIARDLGCSGGMRVVRVAVARKVKHKRCRFVRGNGTLGRPAACRPQHFLIAIGTARWSLTVKGRFTKGRYVVWSLATDNAGNQERRGRHDHHTFAVH